MSRKRWPAFRDCSHCGERLPVGLVLTNHIRAHERKIVGAWLAEFQPKEGELLRVHGESAPYRFVDVVGMDNRRRSPAVRLVRDTLWKDGGTRPVSVLNVPREEWVRRCSEWHVGATGQWYTFTRL